jgi:hypothetical protein
MLQHIDDQKQEEILAGISGLHGPDAREILKHSAIQWKYISNICLHERYNIYTVQDMIRYRDYACSRQKLRDTLARLRGRKTRETGKYLLYCILYLYINSNVIDGNIYRRQFKMRTIACLIAGVI